MIWNKNTGGEFLLNDNYDGYLVDNNVYVSDGLLYLENRKEKIQGSDPEGQFDYTTGWINSLQKINFNGTEKGVYIEIRAQFPKGDKVWPAIWLIDDSQTGAGPLKSIYGNILVAFLIPIELMKCLCATYMGFGTIKKTTVCPFKIFSKLIVHSISFTTMDFFGQKIV